MPGSPGIRAYGRAGGMPLRSWGLRDRTWGNPRVHAVVKTETVSWENSSWGSSTASPVFCTSDRLAPWQPCCPTLCLGSWPSPCLSSKHSCPVWLLWESFPLPFFFTPCSGDSELCLTILASGDGLQGQCAAQPWDRCGAPEAGYDSWLSVAPAHFSTPAQT